MLTISTDETIAAVATDEQPLSSDTAVRTGLTLIGKEKTEEAGEEENSYMDTEGEEENSKGNEVKALNEEEVKKAEAKTAIAAKKDEDKLYPVIDNSYNSLAARQVNITYSLLPIKSESTNPGEREVLVTVYDHDDPPLIRQCRLQDLGELPEIVKDMMAELAKTLPRRAEARAKAKQEEKDKREKRKARLAKSHTKTPMNVRIEANLKHKTVRVLKKLVLSTTRTVTLFFKQVSLRKELPFDVSIPNAESREAIEGALS